MTRQIKKNSAEKGSRSRKFRDLPAKSVGARKAASVKGGVKTGKDRTDYLVIKMNEVLVSGS